MSFTVASIVAAARLRFNDITDTEAVLYLNDIRSDVLAQLSLRKTTLSITTLAVGTSEYALNAAVMNVDQVRYQRSSDVDDFVVLTPITKDDLYAVNSYWKAEENGEPRAFYLWTNTAGAVIGLTPSPSSATSGGYPKLDIDVSQTETLTIASTIYDDLPSATVYINGIKKRFAEDRYSDEAARFDQMYKRDIAAAQRYLYSKNRGAPAVMRPAYMSRRRRVY